MLNANLPSTPPQVGRIARSRGHRLPVGRYVLLVVIGLYTLTVPWPGSVLIPQGIRALIFSQRAYWVALFIGASLVIYFLGATGQFARRLADPLVRRVLVASLVFPTYYAASGLLKNQLSIPVVGLYLTWALFSFLLVPLLVQDRRDLRVALVLLAAAHGLNWTYAFVGASITGATVVLFPDRLSYGYANPNLFAQIPQMFATVLVLLLLLTHDERPSRRRSWMMILALASVMVFAMLARSRNVMLFIIVTAASFQALKHGRRYVVPVTFVLVALLMIMFYSLMTTDIEVLDDVSHRRTLVWRYVFREVVDSEAPVQSLVFGADELALPPSLVPAYSDLGEAKAFQKTHFDNFYLELLIEGGIVGTVAFLLPYILILRHSFRRLFASPGRRTLAWFVSIYFGIAFQSVVGATIPTFAAPLGMTFAVISLAPIAIHDETSRPPGADVSGAS